MAHSYNSTYTKQNLDHLAFPLGGIGAGMICLEGNGCISHVSIRNGPDIFHEPLMFSALHIDEGTRTTVKVLEGPVPSWKVFFPWGRNHGDAGLGISDKTYGLPRFSSSKFLSRFPFAYITLKENQFPINIDICGWSPFIPSDADNSSLPVCALEYSFTNTSRNTINSVFSFHSKNFMADDSPLGKVLRIEKGFILSHQPDAEKPHREGFFCASIINKDVTVNPAWFRGSWFDSFTMVWKDITKGISIDKKEFTTGIPSPGGSLYAPIQLPPGKKKKVVLLFSWYVPKSNLRITEDTKNNSPSIFSRCITTSDPSKETYIPWYAKQFQDIYSLQNFWVNNCNNLKKLSMKFSKTFFNSSLPKELIEAVSANLSIYKSPTMLRQHDGRFWGWEGCGDTRGSCYGSCTHVWAYTQSMSHLFHDLEKQQREVEFLINQNEAGHQDFRTNLPISPPSHSFYAAADGQLAGIIKAYREWRISGDTSWMRSMFPKIRSSLDFCIQEWDPNHIGAVEEPHHNTFDIEFWGPDSMCTTIYLTAVDACIKMGKALEENVREYEDLLRNGIDFLENKLFNGRYFFQKIQVEGMKSKDPIEESKKSLRSYYSEEALALLSSEGPKYQYGNGCLSDGVIGAWLGLVCGLESVFDEEKIVSHLLSAFENNFKETLIDHENTQRTTFGFGKEGGLIVCSWPQGGKPQLPMIYCDEVWTGTEYQVASHLISYGFVEEGLKIVRALRKRYDGTVRNPFNEYECGSWYARSMASYALLQCMTGIRYDAVEKIMYISPVIAGNFSSFISTATGFGTAGVKNGKPFIEVAYGEIPYRKIFYDPFKRAKTGGW